MAKTSTSNNDCHVLIVEDDAFVRDLLVTILHRKGFRTTAVGDGAEIFDVMAKDPAVLVLMDLRLPGEDGFSLTRRLRAQFEVGIIIITSQAGIEARVTGLEYGADDYVTKPFDERELLARIKSVLRRSSEIRSDQTKADGSWLQFHGYRLNDSSGDLIDQKGRRIKLTENEHKLLFCLARNQGNIMARERLMAEVLKRAWSPSDRSIDVLVTRLRRKIDGRATNTTIIKTVRGSGYMLTATAKIDDA